MRGDAARYVVCILLASLVSDQADYRVGVSKLP